MAKYTVSMANQAFFDVLKSKEKMPAHALNMVKIPTLHAWTSSIRIFFLV
jgi:hypothetical protein